MSYTMRVACKRPLCKHGVCGRLMRRTPELRVMKFSPNNICSESALRGVRDSDSQPKGRRSFFNFCKTILKVTGPFPPLFPPQKHWISRNHCNLWKDSASQNQNLGHFKLNPDRLYIQYQVTQVTTWQPSWKMLSVKDKIARDSCSMEWRAHRPFPRPLRQQAQFWIYNRHQVKIY